MFIKLSGELSAPANGKPRFDCEDEDVPDPMFWLLGGKVPNNADPRQVKILEQLRLFQVNYLFSPFVNYLY